MEAPLVLDLLFLAVFLPLEPLVLAVVAVFGLLELDLQQGEGGHQLTAHLLMVALIILGNVVYFAQRRASRRNARGQKA